MKGLPRQLKSSLLAELSARTRARYEESRPVGARGIGESRAGGSGRRTTRAYIRLRRRRQVGEQLIVTRLAYCNHCLCSFSSLN